MSNNKQRSADPAGQHMLKRAEKEGFETVWDRYEAMLPQCGFGQLGVCCRNCYMGPCRVDPFGNGPQKTVCGADADLVVARNLIRQIAVGSAAHSEHGRDVAHALLLASEGHGGYEIKDEVKLHALATEWGIKTDGRKVNEIARDIALMAENEFAKQHGDLLFTKRVPERRREIWKKLGVMPTGIDREIVEAINRSHMGVDNDYRSLVFSGIKTSLADGWGGSMIATELQDILFGRPRPLRAKVNLGVLKKDQVNIVVHGHEPTLSMMLVKASRDPDLTALAKEMGAEGINLAGICCTANEILMRHGIPIAGNHLHQELAILTGAVEAMIVDVQCVMPAIGELAKCFHTEVITTSPKGKAPGTTYMEFHEEKAYDTAREIISKAIKNYQNRNHSKVDIPQEEMDIVAGFTTEEVYNILGGKYRPSYRPLNDGIIAGRIRGVAGIVGCNNPMVPQDFNHVEMTKELLKHDVLVVETGCAAIACGKAGLLKPEAAKDFAGRGLQEICEAVGIPPVLHIGSCVDNTRILTACLEIMKEGGIGNDFNELPAAGAAPEWMSEKAIAIGHYVVGTGIFTLLGGPPLPILGGKNVTKLLTQDMEEITGGKFVFEPDPIKGAHKIINHLNKKREALKLKPMMYPVEVDKGVTKAEAGVPVTV